MTEARFKTIGYLRRRRAPGESSNKPDNSPGGLNERNDNSGGTDGETGTTGQRAPGGGEDQDQGDSTEDEPPQIHDWALKPIRPSSEIRRT